MILPNQYLAIMSTFKLQHNILSNFEESVTAKFEFGYNQNDGYGQFFNCTQIDLIVPKLTRSSI